MALEELEYDHRDFARPQAGDQALFVRFFMHYVPDDDATAQQGRPVFKDTEFVEIRIPGDNTNVVSRPARPEDKRRFARHYEAFKQDREELGDGTRIEEWPLVTRAQVEELRHLGFRTVEHIATAKDEVCSRVPGLVSLKQKAAVYLEAAKGNAPLTAMQAELEQRDSTIAALSQQLADLTALVKAKPTAKAA